MDDLQSLNWTLIDQMVAALTPEQREAAEWRIAHGGKIAMQDFKVCMYTSSIWRLSDFARAERLL